MRITLPRNEDLSTAVYDQLVAKSPSMPEVMAFLKKRLEDYERLKLVHDIVLEEVYSPLLSTTDPISDDELKQMIVEAGWVIDFGRFGKPEELQMWLNRFRRFRAAVIASTKGG